MNPKNHRPLLLACCLALAVCVILPASACRKLFPDKGYVARVWIRVPLPQRGRGFLAEENPATPKKKDAIIAMFHSDSILKAALEQPGIADLECLKEVADKTAWLRERLGTKFVGSSEILDVTVTGKDPEDLKKLVMAVCRTYIEHTVGRQLEQDALRKAELEAALQKAEETLTETKLRYQTLANQLGVPDGKTAKEALGNMLETIDKMRTQVNQIRVEIASLNRERELLESRLDDTSVTFSMQEKQLMMMTILHKDTAISQLQAELANQNSALDTLEQQAENPDENPDVLAFHEQIEQTEQKIRERSQELAPVLEEAMRLIEETASRAEQVENFSESQAEQLRKSIDRVKMDKGAYQSQLESYMKAFQQAVTAGEKISAAEPELDALLAEIKRLENIHQGIVEQLDELTIESMVGSRIQMLDEPMVQKL